jgi:colicin import membrane protein
MNIPADAPFISRPAPKLAAGALALGVHVLFALLLVFGVSWQTKPPAPEMGDLWEALPSSPPPKPRPEPVKVPEPVKAAPAPKPVASEPPPVKAPDIALERKKAEAERLSKQQAIRQAEEKARAEAARENEKQLAEQKQREKLLKMEEEDLMRRMADEEAASAARQSQLAEARAAASKRQAAMAGVVGEFRDLISAKVRGNTRLPDNLKGNPEVRCLVKLLPTGEVQSVQVMKSSGNLAYDEAVKRGIEKSSPLPLPADRDARAAFVPELSFVHRPKE